MPSFPKQLAGFKLDLPDQPLELTDSSYNHRMAHMRSSETEYQEKFGEPFDCPTCRKSAYSNLEGGSDSPDCDSCWSVSEHLGMPKAKWEKPNSPIIADKPDEFWNESNYHSKEYGMHYCGQTNEMNGSTCDYTAESRAGLEDHWDKDPEHNTGKGN